MFKWNDCQVDAAKSVFSLIKTNNGFWKSDKQRSFIMKQMQMYYLIHKFDESNKLAFGVELLSNQQAWCLDGYIRWADYGRRSFREVTHMFVFDQYGIVAQYKLHRKYSSDGGSSSINSDKTEKIWNRDESIEKPVLVVTDIQNTSEHLGSVGEWLETAVTIKSIRSIGESYYGPTYQTRMVDDLGNMIIYWGVMKSTYCGEENIKIKLRAKIKEHSEYKGMKQTIVGYAKIKEVIE